MLPGSKQQWQHPRVIWQRHRSSILASQPLIGHGDGPPARLPSRAGCRQARLLGSVGREGAALTARSDLQLEPLRLVPQVVHFFPLFVGFFFFVGFRPVTVPIEMCK